MTDFPVRYIIRLEWPFGAVLKNMNIIQKIPIFLKEVASELKKVTWPTKQETARHTLVVIIVCIIVAIFLGGIDYLFTYLLNKFVI